MLKSILKNIFLIIIVTVSGCIVGNVLRLNSENFLSNYNYYDKGILEKISVMQKIYLKKDCEYVLSMILYNSYKQKIYRESKLNEINGLAQICYTDDILFQAIFIKSNNKLGKEMGKNDLLYSPEINMAVNAILD